MMYNLKSLLIFSYFGLIGLTSLYEVVDVK